MKRILFVSLCTLMLAVSAFSQDKAAQIADVKNQITALENETPAMLKTLDTLKTEKENQIDFVGQAYDKQNRQYEQDMAAFTQKVENVKHQQAVLQPAIDNYEQRVNAHNAHQCVETNHDGSCGWYTAEKNQLDANLAQIQQAAAPIEAAKAQLRSEASNLTQTHDKLVTISDNLNNEIASWKGRVEQLKNDWEAHEAKMAALEAKLAALYGDANACLTEAAQSPTCQNPAIGPDGKPILNQDCERVVARCRRMFDGSK